MFFFSFWNTLVVLCYVQSIILLDKRVQFYSNCVPKVAVITKLPRKLQMYDFTPGKLRIYYTKLPLALPNTDDGGLCIGGRRVLVPFAKMAPLWILISSSSRGRRYKLYKHLFFSLSHVFFSIDGCMKQFNCPLSVSLSLCVFVHIHLYWDMMN